ALDRVYCLTAAHRAALVALLPPSRARTVELLDPDGRDVLDPIGRPVEEYVLCAERVGEAVERRLDEWA
ncbi:MAG TPA: hypothetical protein VJP77_06040, partial [Planctomycetota bacterium]|nr:hypothetical protein [Planctomycetota bacterium]